MRTFFLAILTVLSLPLYAESFNTCCLCIGDPDDGKVTKECSKWFTLPDQKKCEFKKEIYSKDAGVSHYNTTCEDVKVWGGFHGQSSYYLYPFEISKKVARAYSAKSVEYDGSTCLLFNNTTHIKTTAERLAASDPDTHYTITGNQNIGVVNLAFLRKPTENLSMSSKMTVEIDKGRLIDVTYGECSRAYGTCGLALTADVGANSPSDTKFCMQDGQVLEQTCCPKNAKSEWGIWSTAGETCDSL